MQAACTQRSCGPGLRVLAAIVASTGLGQRGGEGLGLYRYGRGWGPGTSKRQRLSGVPHPHFVVSVPLPTPGTDFPKVTYYHWALFISSLTCAESCFAQKGAMGEGGALSLREHFLLSILVRTCLSLQRPRTRPFWCLCSERTALSSQEAHSASGCKCAQPRSQR